MAAVVLVSATVVVCDANVCDEYVDGDARADASAFEHN
jgi:hypothetical protein